MGEPRRPDPNVELARVLFAIQRMGRVFRQRLQKGLSGVRLLHRGKSLGLSTCLWPRGILVHLRDAHRGNLKAPTSSVVFQLEPIFSPGSDVFDDGRQNPRIRAAHRRSEVKVKKGTEIEGRAAHVTHSIQVLSHGTVLYPPTEQHCLQRGEQSN